MVNFILHYYKLPQYNVIQLPISHDIPMLPRVVVFGISPKYLLAELEFTRRISRPLHNHSPMIPDRQSLY